MELQTTPSPISQIKYNKQLVQFLPRLLHPLGICGVDDIDQRIGIVEVVGPVLPQCLLAPDIPDVELEFIVGEVLDVEALSRGDSGDVLNETEATSFDKALRIVVLPALSKPKTKIRRSSFLLFRRFRRIPIRPLPWLLIIEFF